MSQGDQYGLRVLQKASVGPFNACVDAGGDDSLTVCLLFGYRLCDVSRTDDVHLMDNGCLRVKRRELRED